MDYLLFHSLEERFTIYLILTFYFANHIYSYSLKADSNLSRKGTYVIPFLCEKAMSDQSVCNIRGPN